MFITWRTYSATTGPIEQRVDYACGHCGTRAAAMVRTTGAGSSTAVYGAGGGAEQARRGAAQSAWSNAAHAMTTVPCPHCGRLPNLLLAQIEAARAKVDKRRRLRVPLVAIAAVLAALVTIPFAVRDLRSSASGLVAAIAAVTLAASFAGMVTSWPTHLPSLIRRAEVWLWWGQPSGEPGWVQAPPAAPPVAPIRVMRAGYIISLISLLASGVFGTVALAFLANTFVDVLVVDVANKGGIIVEIDGKVAGPIKKTSTTADVTFADFSVRRGREHKVVLIDPSGARRTLTLDDAKDGKRGWVVAPDAAAHDLCIADSEIVYASSTSTARAPESKLLNAKGGDVLPLTNRHDYTFEAPPKTISTKASEERKRALRGYVCSEIDEDKLVPFRDAPSKTAVPKAGSEER